MKGGKNKAANPEKEEGGGSGRELEGKEENRAGVVVNGRVIV